MNVNDFILGLEPLTGLKVQPDLHTGGEENYITFTYASEVPEICADDAPEADTATIYVNLYTEQSFNYLELKETIKNYFESRDECVVPLIYTGLEDYKTNANTVKYKRHTTFEVEITQWR
jgi:hypothetical protein